MYICRLCGLFHIFFQKNKYKNHPLENGAGEVGNFWYVVEVRKTFLLEQNMLLLGNGEIEV